MPTRPAAPALDEVLADDRINRLPEFLSVDFNGCDAREVASIYRALAVRLLTEGGGPVMLNAPQGVDERHRALRDIALILLRESRNRSQYRFAICTPPALPDPLFSQLVRELRDMGLDVRVFHSDAEAAAWLIASGA